MIDLSQAVCCQCDTSLSEMLKFSLVVLDRDSRCPTTTPGRRNVFRTVWLPGTPACGCRLLYGPGPGGCSSLLSLAGLCQPECTRLHLHPSSR